MEGEQASSRSPTTPSNNTSDNADNGAAVIRSGLSDGFEICGCDKKSCSESIDILVDGQRWTIHMSCTGSSSMNFFSCRVCGAHQKFQKDGSDPFVLASMLRRHSTAGNKCAEVRKVAFVDRTEEFPPSIVPDVNLAVLVRENLRFLLLAEWQTTTLVTLPSLHAVHCLFACRSALEASFTFPFSTLAALLCA